MLLITTNLLRRTATSLAATLFILCATFGVSSAQDYEIVTPSKNVKFYFETGTQITVRNLTVDTLEFSVHLGGDDEFSLYDFDYFPIVDNTMKIYNKWGVNEAPLTVFYKPNDNSISHAWLQIDHGTRSDTIFFEGEDTTLKWRSTADLKILGAHPILITPGSADSVDLYIKYKNFGNTDMLAEMNIYNINKGYAFNLMNPASFVARAGITDSMLVRFYNDKQTFPVNAILSLKNLGNFKDSVMLIALGPVRTAGNPPEFDVVPFYDISPGESACHTFTIINTNDQPMEVSGPYNGIESLMYLSGVTFPITIPANSSSSMQVCLTVPDTTPSGSLIYGYFRMGYTDMLDVTTSRDIAIPAWIDPCFTLTTDSLHFEPTIIGGWVDADITIVNNTSTDLKLKADFETNNGRVYPIDKRQYIQVPANSSTTTAVRMIPSGTGPVDSWLRLNPFPLKTCSEFTFGRYFGFGVAPNEDSVTLDIFGDQTNTIAMKGEQTAVERLFKFKNTTSGAITVVSIALESGTHFTISNMTPAGLPLTLQPGELIAVTLQFDADTNGMYRDRLVVVTEGAATSQYFSVQGLQENATPTSDVKPGPTHHVELHISPNPANGPIKIELSGAGFAQLELIDLLGASIHTQDMTSTVTLSAEDLSNGIYIVRVSGLDDEGSPFVISRQIRVKR